MRAALIPRPDHPLVRFAPRRARPRRCASTMPSCAGLSAQYYRRNEHQIGAVYASSDFFQLREAGARVGQHEYEDPERSGAAARGYLSSSRAQSSRACSPGSV